MKDRSKAHNISSHIGADSKKRSSFHARLFAASGLD